MANEDIVIDYNILEDKIIHKTEIVKSLFGLPMEINHAQDYLVRYGVTSRVYSTFGTDRLIHRVGKWTLENAAYTCKQWRKIIPNFTVSINISFVQLQEQKFKPYLEKQIENRLITPETMHLEITESYIADGNRSLSKLTDKLRALGFKIEIDNFGTGYSFLEILKNSPADLVKIN